jgi:hypothetical protein
LQKFATLVVSGWKGGALEAAGKHLQAVILRRQQPTKDLYLLENSNADPSLLLRMTS